MRNLVSVCLALLFMVSMVVSTQAKELKKNFHESFDVHKGMRLKLKHGDGDVTIKPWDRDVLEVEVHYRARYKSLGFGGERDFVVIFKQNGDVIEVIGEEKTPGFAGVLYFDELEYTYTIRGPSYLELRLEGDDGDVEIEGWEGDIDCELSDGDIDFTNIAAARTRIKIDDGDVDIKGHRGKLTMEGADGDLTLTESEVSPCLISLEDGDVRIKQCEGDFQIDLDDGEVRLYRLKSEKLDIESEDGDIDVDIIGVKQIDLDIRTDDGDVTLFLPSSISAAFMIDVDDGSIDIDFPSTSVLKKSRHSISGEIRKGKGRIKIITSDGDVVLRETK